MKTDFAILLAVTFGTALGLSLLLVWTPRHRAEDDSLAVVDLYRVDGMMAPELPHAPARESKLTRVALAFLDRQVRQRGMREKIVASIEAAGLRMRPEEWAMIRISLSLVAGAVLMIVLRSPLLGLLIGPLLAWIGTRLYLSIRTGKRQAAFSDQLPDVLQLVSGALRSGFSLSQSLDTVVREADQPAAEEFGRALAEVRFGADIEEALDRIAERMKCPDLGWVVMAIRIQRSVGGNLAEVLMTTVSTMRERSALRRQVRALSAEGRLSGRILIALPIFVVGFVQVSNPVYISPLFHKTSGMIIFGLAVFFEIAGSLWIRKVAKVEL